MNDMGRRCGDGWILMVVFLCLAGVGSGVRLVDEKMESSGVVVKSV